MVLCFGKLGTLLWLDEGTILYYEQQHFLTYTYTYSHFKVIHFSLFNFKVPV